MKLKITVIEGDEKINLSAWGSTSGNTGGPATTGAEFEVEGEQVSLSAQDPIPGASDAG